MPSFTRKSNAGRVAARRGEMRARMLEAVERLLAGGDTFTELSVERIVAEAGTSRTTFYAYFDDKGHMLRELTEDVLEQLVGAGRGWWSGIAESDTDALRDGIHDLVFVYREHATLIAAIIDTSSYDAEVRAGYEGMVEVGRAELAGHIRAGQKSGAVRAELNADRTAGWIVWMVDRGLHEMVRIADDTGAKAYADELVLVLRNLLYEPG